MAALAFQPPARIVRALTLADLLDAAGISAADAATFHPREWRMLAKAASSTRIPSEQTRGLVVDLDFLRRREAIRAMFASSRLTR
jgi:hypothetical protein